MSPPPVAVEAILCPTDFSVFSARALRHAVALAQQFGARLKVAHVLPGLGGLVAHSPLPDAVASVLPAMRDRAEAEARRFVEPAREARVPLEIRICDGEPWREILAQAEQLPADLVVMGTHGRSGFERFVLGSVTEKLLRLLPCPVLTVCHEEGRTWEAPGLVRRILCATDLSESLLDTAAFALLLAAKHQATLTLLHVVEELPGTAASLSCPGGGLLGQELERVAAEELREAARELENRFGVEIDTRLAGGRVHREILRIASEERAELIVMGGRRHSLGRFLLGSNSHHIVREATCPVLTVRPVVERKPQVASALVLKAGA